MSICWDRSQISRASFRAISLCEREEIFMPSSTSDFQILRKQNSNVYWNKGSSNFLARCGEKQGTAGVYGHCWCLRCQIDWTVLHKHELAA